LFIFLIRARISCGGHTTEVVNRKIEKHCVAVGTINVSQEHVNKPKTIIYLYLTHDWDIWRHSLSRHSRRPFWFQMGTWNPVAVLDTEGILEHWKLWKASVWSGPDTCCLADGHALATPTRVRLSVTPQRCFSPFIR
jgi:hypothetical protein